jgi:phage shock protein E
MRRVLLFATAACTLVLCATRDGSTPGVRRVSVNDVADTLANDNPVVLDIRTPEEVAQARLTDTVVNVDFYAPTFASDVAVLDRTQTYVLYCRSGQRTSHAAQLMADLNFADVRELAGGLISWVDAGKPLRA